ncbi:hypothetical protein GGR53DRAFT_470119 [Hypoxylon sp. FL1150]|nr:hypothetical protein GGR53DRAFT_470119 [Hypoxylon sp. FL1150]
MCNVCYTLVQQNFSCGHQHLLRKEKAAYCLFYPHTADEYHSLFTQYQSKPRDHECKECMIRKEAGTKGLRGAERHEFVKNTYARTWESRSRVEAKNAIAQAKKSRDATDISEEGVAAINVRARDQVKFYLGRCGRGQMTPAKRRHLLKIILEAPPAVDRKALIRVFGSYCVFDQKDNAWKGMPSEERSILVAIARRAGLSRTLEEGLAMQKPEDLE